MVFIRLFVFGLSVALFATLLNVHGPRNKPVVTLNDVNKSWIR